jgi:hypothetical protein
LSSALQDAAHAEGRELDLTGARQAIVEHCVFGTDLDPRAVLLTQLSMFTCFGMAIPDEHMCVGDGLRISPRESFDAVLGNPPWIAYVGRAAQPLSKELARHYRKHFASFRGYRSLHGLFVERAARLLTPGGRLGLILPTSMSDLAGYTSVRDAHDHWCEVDNELPDFGDDAFEGVFQPCMALLSTRRAVAEPVGPDTLPEVLPDGPPGAWPLVRRDLSTAARRLLARLAAWPTMPRELFGERGYQTRPEDRRQLKANDGVLAEGERLLHTGTEVLEFETRAPRWKVDPETLQAKLRPPAAWQGVSLLIRQTARYPIASYADGHAFRNSVIAGFENQATPKALLLSWLNSSAIRWYHFHQQRDARQGMPQVKVAHLRALPAPPTLDSQHGAALCALGATLGNRNSGISAEDRHTLDALVAAVLHLDKEDLELVSEWALTHPPPRPRTGR